jgi:glycosyltransferase involved in cell wall biosynthesis
MASERPLIIGYSGSLAYYDGKSAVRKNRLRDWFWTYNHYVTDPSTRSAFFLFKAIQLLKEKYKIQPSQLQVQLWGNIHAGNLQQAKEMGISEFLQISGYLPKQESIERNNTCDLLFLPMESATENGKPLFIPGKVFEYMKAGKPVLALAGPCDCLDILRPSGLLIEFNPRAAEEIAEELNKIILNRDILSGYIPDADYISSFSFRNITAKLAATFNEVLNK